MAGMHWLQATFANRFNRLRGERGHLFQGRYKALLVEDGDPLGLVCHYIHLNPVRAGILPVERLPDYRFSSYWYMGQPRQRPPFLRPDVALTAAGGLADTPQGRDHYARYLDWQVREGPTGKSQAYTSLSTGWALGSVGFRTALVQDHALLALTRAWESTGAKEIKETLWANSLEGILRHAGILPSQLACMPKSAVPKLAIAAWMKMYTQASGPWLCAHLDLGSPDAFRRNVSHYRRHIQPSDPFWRKLTTDYST